MPVKKKPIILCCGQNGRAVLFGYVGGDPVPGQPVTLTDARMVIYWPAACGGLLGLAAKGPKEGSRITHAVPSVTETVWQECLSVTGEAEKRIAGWAPFDG